MPPSRRARFAVAAAVALIGAAVVLRVGAAAPAYVSDFDPIRAGAHALRVGGDPYTTVGPTGRAFYSVCGLLYPMPALLLVLPLDTLPLVWARAVFVAMSSALLAFAITRDGYHRLPIFGSAAYLWALVTVQWSPLLTAAALIPGIGAVLAAKPTIGAAIAGSYPTRRAFTIAAAGALALGLGSLAVLPGWPIDWLREVAACRAAGYAYKPPILAPGGFLCLLALSRWRRPEARLLVLLACVPQNPVLYEGLMLFLIPATLAESAILALLTFAVRAAADQLVPHGSTYFVAVAINLELMVALLYLPCLAFVLRRPNVAPADAPRHSP